MTKVLGAFYLHCLSKLTIWGFIKEGTTGGVLEFGSMTWTM